MRIYPEKLAAHLQQQLLPVYLVTGDEPLLVQECADQVRAAARAGGCTEREVIEASGANFDWQTLLHSAGSMSLFGDRRLLELRLPGGKPGAEGSKALCEYLDLPGDDVLLLVAGKIDKQSTRSKWYKALDQAGAVVTLYPVRKHELPNWLRQRLGGAGLTIDSDALELLSERLEGNLLAAVQEVEKLKLLAPGDHVDLATVTAAVLDNARYNLFGLVDSAVEGEAAASLRMLQGLRDEGTEPMVVLWALNRELRTLVALRTACDRGQRPEQAMKAQRVWVQREGIVGKALARHDRESLSQLLELAFRVDGSIKGFDDGNCWDNLEQLVAGLCRVPVPHMPGALA